jgi:enamine deaminase RidA (YjgF/YER057c/UK114 family)
MRRRISSGSTFEADIGYSRVVVDDRWVFVSGTTGFEYSTMRISEDLLTQAEQCMANIGGALAGADSSFADVVRVHYLFPDRADFEPCWPIFRRYLAGAAPAATMMVVGLSDPRMRLEVEVTALRAPPL